MNINEYREYKVLKTIKTRIKTLKCYLTKQNKKIPLFYIDTFITEAKINELEKLLKEIKYILQPEAKINDIRNCFEKQNKLEKKQNELVAKELIRGINAKNGKKKRTI